MASTRFSKADLIAIASQFKTRGAFSKGNPSAYSSALRRNILDEVCQHMPTPKRWTLKEIQQLASNYEYIQDFYTQEPLAYKAAVRHHWKNLVVKGLKYRYDGDQKKYNNKMTKQHLLDIIYYQQNALSKSHQIDIPKDMVMRYLTEMAGLVANLED